MSSYVLLLPRAGDLRLLSTPQLVECDIKTMQLKSVVDGENSAQHSHQFLTNLPLHHLEFDLEPTAVHQLMNLCLLSTVDDVKQLYSRLCMLLHQHCLVFRKECRAPEWYKRHPAIIQKIYSKWWHPLVVIRLIVVGKLDCALFAIQQGAYFPLYMYNAILSYLGYVPEQSREYLCSKV
jgi:hypothetical protein